INTSSSNNFLTVGKENLTPSHINILSPSMQSTSSSRHSQPPSFAKPINSISSTSSNMVSTASTTKATVGSYMRSKSYVYVPSLDELKQIHQPIHSLAELYAKFTTFNSATMYLDQKLQFIRVCIKCIEEGFLRVYEKEIYMFWMLIAVSLLGCGNEKIEAELREKLYAHFEHLTAYNHPIKDEENFYILNAQYEWKVNDERERCFRSLSKIQQGLKRLGE